VTEGELLSMTTAAAIAAELIRSEEGCVLTAYPDPASPLAKHTGTSGAPWTIGYGHTGADVRPGTVWTRKQAEDALSIRVAGFQSEARRTWAGADKLSPYAEAALISLAYNRGTDLRKKAGDAMDRRREMRELIPAVAARDYERMAQLFESMCRIWEGKGLNGLLTRRRREAALCRKAKGGK